MTFAHSSRVLSAHSNAYNGIDVAFDISREAGFNYVDDLGADGLRMNDDWSETLDAMAEITDEETGCPRRQWIIELAETALEEMTDEGIITEHEDGTYELAEHEDQRGLQPTNMESHEWESLLTAILHDEYEAVVEHIEEHLMASATLGEI